MSSKTIMLEPIGKVLVDLRTSISWPHEVRTFPNGLGAIKLNLFKILHFLTLVLKLVHNALVIHPANKLRFPNSKDQRARGQPPLGRLAPCLLGLHPSKAEQCRWIRHHPGQGWFRAENLNLNPWLATGRFMELVGWQLGFHKTGALPTSLCKCSHNHGRYRMKYELPAF